MPEAAVHEDGQTLAAKDEVRLAGPALGPPPADVAGERDAVEEQAADVAVAEAGDAWGKAETLKS